MSVRLVGNFVRKCGPTRDGFNVRNDLALSTRRDDSIDAHAAREVLCARPRRHHRGFQRGAIRAAIRSRFQRSQGVLPSCGERLGTAWLRATGSISGASPAPPGKPSARFAGYECIDSMRASSRRTPLPLVSAPRSPPRNLPAVSFEASALGALHQSCSWQLCRTCRGVLADVDHRHRFVIQSLSPAIGSRFLPLTCQY
jgi:hypothetical protein